MSRLSTNTKIVYCAVYYTEDGFGVRENDNESIDYDFEDDAIDAAKMYCSMMNENMININSSKHYFARIEKRIVPIYC